jgi:hypothetical protein
MSLKKEANQGHLYIGASLALLTLILAIIKSIYSTPYLEFAIFAFGVFGGVEAGRWLEWQVRKKLQKQKS